MAGGGGGGEWLLCFFLVVTPESIKALRILYIFNAYLWIISQQSLTVVRGGVAPSENIHSSIDILAGIVIMQVFFRWPYC